jgi:large subunit ribosomal protein L24
MKLHVKKGDNVKILTGKDKGKTGKISAVFPDSGRVVVENNNIIIKHVKAKSANSQSSIQKLAGSIDASNVQIICPACSKTTRVGHTENAGAKEGQHKFGRVCRKCGAKLDVKVTKVNEKKAKKAKDAAAIPAEEVAGKKSAKQKIVKNEDGAVV